MKYSYYDLGRLDKGQIVEVRLSAAANVRLMDSSNYSSYKASSILWRLCDKKSI